MFASPGQTAHPDRTHRHRTEILRIRELAKHAKAPPGSTYHYFPEGKPQLATEAVQYAGGAVARILGEVLDEGPVAGLRAFLALWRGIAAAEAFEAWEQLLAQALREHGADRERARGLAALIVASVEGAIAMCRAKRSMQPLDQAAQQLDVLIADALDDSA